MESPLTDDYMHIDDNPYTVTTCSWQSRLILVVAILAQAFPFSSFVVVKTLCTDTAHTSVKRGSGALSIASYCWASSGRELKGLSQKAQQ